jgi:hypothetical protein
MAAAPPALVLPAAEPEPDAPDEVPAPDDAAPEPDAPDEVPAPDDAAPDSDAFGAAAAPEDEPLAPAFAPPEPVAAGSFAGS